MPRHAGASTLDPGLLILASLASGPKHGYAITLDVRSFAGVGLGPGTVYGAIARLEGQGLIEPAPAPPDDRRRPYRLTPGGRDALRTRLASLERVTATGLGRLASVDAG